MYRRVSTDALIERVLQGETLSLQVVHYQVAEYVGPDSPCRVTLTVCSGPRADAERESIEGQGVGFVDAAYRGLMAHFTKAYASLATLEFTGFSIRGRMNTGQQISGLDAEVEVSLGVRNASGRKFEFQASDRSTLAAAVAVVTEVASYFVNAERAYVRVHRALADAERRARADLVERYTAELAELVNTTSYQTISAQVRPQ